MKEKKSVMPAADLAIRLIELFARECRPLRLAEIASGLNSNLATTIRLLTVFEENDWIRRVGAKGPYRLTYRPLHSISQALSTSRISRIAIPYIEKLAAKTKCLSVLAVPDERSAVCVVCSDASLPIRIATDVGSLYSFHSSAAAKAIMAWQNDEKIEEFLATELKKRTEHTICSLELLRQEYAETRKRGYSFDKEEEYIGVLCLGVPVFGCQGGCIASVAIGTLMFYNSSRSLVKKKDSVIKVGETISRLMGYSGPYPTDRQCTYGEEDGTAAQSKTRKKS